MSDTTDIRDPDEDAPVEAKRRVSARDVALWGARTTTGLIGVGAAVAIVGAAFLVTPPTWSADPRAIEVVPEPATEILVCPGALLRLGDASGQAASQASPLGDPSYAAAIDGGDLPLAPVAASDAGTAGSAAAPHVASIAPGGTGTPAASAMQAQLLAGGETAGLATAACTPPSSRSWLVAGATTLGRTTLVTLTNPTVVDAVVTLDLYGASGAIEAPGLEGIAVPAGSQRVLSLAGFTIGEAAPVVHVTSTGGDVAAAIQQSIIRTLTPGGIDLTTAQVPSDRLVIPGVVVAGEAALGSLVQGVEDSSDAKPVLRLFATAGVATRATVSFVPTGHTLADVVPEVPGADAPPTDTHSHADDEPVAISFEVDIPPGAVLERPVVAIPPGEYLVFVDADAPVVGAVRASVITDRGVDFAWFPPAAPLTDRTLLAAPPGAFEVETPGAIVGLPSDAGPVVSAPTVSVVTTRSTLVLANPTAAPVTVTMAVDGVERALEVPGGGFATAQVPGGATVSLDGTAGLSAVLRTEGPGIAASALPPPASRATPVTVYP